MATSPSISQQKLLVPPELRPRRRLRPPVGRLAAREGEGRLEARVEEREGGYWVLKEKFRRGINQQEKVKLEKDPMALVFEDGIGKMAATPMEEIEACKTGKDDVDTRLKWLGLFHRRKHQSRVLVLHRHAHIRAGTLELFVGEVCFSSPRAVLAGQFKI